MAVSQVFSTILILLTIYYIITQILNFYGIKQDVYGIYLLFFIFIALSSIILKRNYISPEDIH